MKNSFNQALVTAILTLLKPLVRILLRNGIAHDSFVDLTKRVYVDVAFNEFVIPGKKQTISRVSVLTGLTRKEVSRLAQQDTPDDLGANDRYNRAVRVISGWLNNPGFVDSQGEPRDLPIEGNPLSFSELVRSYSGDIPTQAMLAELVRVRAVEKLEDGRVRLRQHAYIPSSDPVDKIYILGTDVAELTSTIDHNLNPGDQPLFFQRKVSNNNFPALSLTQFRELSATKAQGLLEDLDSWLSEQELQSDTNSERLKVGLGIYYFQAPKPKE